MISSYLPVKPTTKFTYLLLFISVNYLLTWNSPKQRTLGYSSTIPGSIKVGNYLGTEFFHTYILTTKLLNTY